MVRIRGWRLGGWVALLAMLGTAVALARPRCASAVAAQILAVQPHFPAVETTALESLDKIYALVEKSSLGHDTAFDVTYPQGGHAFYFATGIFGSSALTPASHGSLSQWASYLERILFLKALLRDGRANVTAVDGRAAPLLAALLSGEDASESTKRAWWHTPQYPSRERKLGRENTIVLAAMGLGVGALVGDALLLEHVFEIPPTFAIRCVEAATSVAVAFGTYGLAHAIVGVKERLRFANFANTIQAVPVDWQKTPQSLRAFLEGLRATENLVPPAGMALHYAYEGAESGFDLLYEADTDSRGRLFLIEWPTGVHP